MSLLDRGAGKAVRPGRILPPDDAIAEMGAVLSILLLIRLLNTLSIPFALRLSKPQVKRPSTSAGRTVFLGWVNILII